MSSKYEKFEDVDTGVCDEFQLSKDSSPSTANNSSTVLKCFASDLSKESVEIIVNPVARGLPIQDTPISGGRTLGNHSEIKVSFAETSVDSSKSKYEEFPRSNESLSPIRFKVRHFIEHIAFRITSLIFILIDCTILIAQFSNPTLSEKEQQTYEIITAAFSTYFCLEISLRIYARGVTNFFSDWYNSVDFVIIFLSMLTTMTGLVMQSYGSLKLISLGRLIRAFVLVRFIRAFYTEPRNIQRGIRKVVSENKRRMRIGRFDLDLTYIKKNIIAMSFPSSGRMAYYRNHIRDVAEYLDERHGANRYRVYNLCSERAYDTKYFHAQVARFEIDDHNVPTLQQMAALCQDAKQFLEQSPDNVVAIHCKGGKGRTGTMICALLVYLGYEPTAEKALDAFSSRRTDTRLTSKFQGVETPSQSRYVRYFAEWLNQTSTTRPPTVPLQPYSVKPMQMPELRLIGLIGVGTGDGSDFTCRIVVDRKQQFTMDFGASKNCSVEYKGEQDALYVHPINCPILVGDVRFEFNCRSKSVPVNYDNCAFFFWFNTSFECQNQNQLRLTRTELDNPHKSKTWKVFRERFAIELDLIPSVDSQHSSSV